MQNKIIVGSPTAFSLLHIDVLQKTRGSFTNAGGSDTTAMNIEIFKPIARPVVSNEPMKSKKSPSYAFSISGYVQSLAMTIFGPFPWQLSAKKYAALGVDTLFVYVLIGFSVWGIFRSKWKNFKNVIPWLTIAVIIYAAIAMGTDNLGAIVRQRIPAVIVIGLIAAYLYDKKK